MAFGGSRCYPREVDLDPKQSGILSKGSLMAQKALGSSIRGGFQSLQKYKVSNKPGKEQESIYLPRELQLFNKKQVQKIYREK